MFTALMVSVFISAISIQMVHAGVMSQIYSQVKSVMVTQSIDIGDTHKGNSQTVIALKPSDLRNIADNTGTNIASTLTIRPSTDMGMGGGDDDNGAVDTAIYEVKDGDSMTSVAKMFDVSQNTIRWANSLKSDSFKVGQILIIPPITGVIHDIKSGDTVESIAKKYKADKADIYRYNGLNEKSDLNVGDSIVIPDGEIVVATDSIKVKPKAKVKKSVYKKDGSSRLIESYTDDLGAYFMRPISGGKKTQGLHGHNGIDLGGVPVGTSVMAAAAGTVTVARNSGYNGGYGEMIIIKHDNGTMTVYGHLSAVYVYEGQSVSQGDSIGALGNTGKSTGPHLHFEVRGAVNPF